jgi:hypothetical protein
MNRFPDQFLPTPACGDPAAWAWAWGEARRLPLVVLACLDPFTLRDRIVDYEASYDPGAQANALVLRAVLDRAVAWQADRLPTRPAQRQGGGGGREC